MKVKYQLAQMDNNPNWTKPGFKGIAMARMRARARKAGGPYKVKERGEDNWSNAQGLPTAMDNVGRRLTNGNVGDLVLLSCNTDRENGPVFGIRIVHVKKLTEKVPPVPSCTPAIADVWRAVWAQFGGKITSWGICNCRKIAGQSDWSQHAWCNAWDIHGTVDTMNQVAHFLMQNYSKLNLAYVLWQGHSLTSGNAVDDHYDHVHVDCKPTRTGTPPCA